MFHEHLDRVPPPASADSGFHSQAGRRSPALHRAARRKSSASTAHRLGQLPVRGAGDDLERPDRVREVVQDVGRLEGVQRAEAEHAATASGPASPVCAFTPSSCWNVRTRKPSNPALRSARLELGLVHAEAARPAAARREEDVAVHDVLARHAGGLEFLEVLDQVADREVGRVAQAVVAVLLADEAGGQVGLRQRLAAVAARPRGSPGSALRGGS